MVALFKKVFCESKKSVLKSFGDEAIMQKCAEKERLSVQGTEKCFVRNPSVFKTKEECSLCADRFCGDVKKETSKLLFCTRHANKKAKGELPMITTFF